MATAVTTHGTHFHSLCKFHGACATLLPWDFAEVRFTGLTQSLSAVHTCPASQEESSGGPILCHLRGQRSVPRALTVYGLPW